MHEIVQFVPAIPTAASNKDNPTSVITGAIARGDISVMITPTSPLMPINSSINEADIIAPDTRILNFVPKIHIFFCKMMRRIKVLLPN